MTLRFTAVAASGAAIMSSPPRPLGDPHAGAAYGPAYVWDEAACCATTVDVVRVLAHWRSLGRRVVLTNGCFDLVHVGHLRYLAEARALGDALVVALNDDDSTAVLKGEGRPIVPLAERAELLCALRVVDAVVPFAGPTATAVVTALRPQAYVKGGDYDWSTHVPPEAIEARRLGADVHFTAFHDGRSSSTLIRRILESEAARERRGPVAG